MSSKAQTREKDYERGIRIADRRKEIGLSQEELAHRVGIGRQALSAIENGGDFKTQTLDNLAIVLGVSVDFIMYGKNEEKSELLSEAMDVLSDMDEILTFYGIRKAESVSRSKYNRIEDSADAVKIKQQTVASPIFFWKDIDIWLYILSEKIDFNDAYRLGYDRVGCWCCPNNNQRAQFLSRIYMPEKSTKWRDFLISFAAKIGKPDPEVYVDEGKWKARQGGNGLPAAGDVKIRFTNCTAEEHAKIYRLNRPFDEELTGMFVPFGRVAPELGRKLLHEVLVLDIKSNVPILSLQPFTQDGFEYSVKVRTLNVADHDDLQRMVGYQIRKFNACRKCLKCESVCRAGAISISNAGYYIDPQKCVHCKACMTAKYLDGGCMMDKYLRTK